jgi:hypothetical protein
MIGGDGEVGKRFVVAQEHVVAWLEALDQIAFEQQRFGFGGGRYYLKVVGRGDHALDAYRQPFGPRVGDDPFLDVFGFADVEDRSIFAEHAVNAWFAGEGRQQAAQNLGSGADRALIRLTGGLRYFWSIRVVVCHGVNVGSWMTRVNARFNRYSWLNISCDGQNAR